MSNIDLPPSVEGEPAEQPLAGSSTNHGALTLPQAMQQAAVLYSVGDWAKAARLCTWVLNSQNCHFDALSLLGLIAAQTGHTREAADLLQRAVAARPSDAAAHVNYGNVLQALERFEAALDSSERALQLQPHFAEAHFNRGNALHALKRFEAALDSYECALQLKPDLAVAYNNRGNAQCELKRFEAAVDSYERALQRKPDYAEAYFNRANAQCELKRFEAAVDSYERALQLKSDYADAYFNRGNAQRGLKRFEAALDSYQRVLQLKPDDADAYFNRGNTLRDLRRLDAALDSYRRALNLNPDVDLLYGSWLHTKMLLCAWDAFDSRVAELVGKIEQGRRATTPFAVLSLIDSVVLQRRAAQTWIREQIRERAELPPIGKPGRRPRIRLGYYSADFREHPVAVLAAGLFERHDKERFELIAFSFGPETRDDTRKRLVAAFDEFVDVRARSDKEIAQISRELQIDIAVDLNGFTQDARTEIFAYRAAPVQVSYLGYPGTMGAPYMDYLIADRTLIPENSRHGYSEKIAYLPHSFQVNDRLRQIAPEEPGREALGLPARGFVFCCFNTTYKITPPAFDIWMRILRRVEGSVLWLSSATETAVDNLRHEAHARGVDATRLIFAARTPKLSQHLARHRAADLFLDTWPYNAHTTASDALWAGVPVLTRIGESYAGRVAASLLNAVGLPELVTTTAEQYEALAVELASSPARLAEVRQTLQRNRLTTPLFDTALFTRHIEDAYSQMYERYQADLSPDHIFVAH